MKPDRPRPPITEDMAEVAELAAALPDRGEELLRRGFEALADSLPSTLAAFLELDGTVLTLRAVVDDSRAPTTPRPRTPIGTVAGLNAVIERRDSVLIDDAELRAQTAAALGNPEALSASGQTLLVPVAARERPMGLLLFHNPAPTAYGPETLRIANLFANILALGILATRQADEVEHYRNTLEERNRLLVEDIAAETDACRALERSRSRVMRRLSRMAKQVAVTSAPVLITGETGSGKEVVARAVHAWSDRSESPFVQLNCAALPENLVESELFGHVKGAFTGAGDNRLGRFRAADGGTILLDEIGDLPLSMQVKLLRVLQEGSFEPVGSDETVTVDVRVIATTNRDLDRAVEEGHFREDLYYRLQVFPLTVPPLRERRDDLEVLVEHLLERAARRTGRGPWTVSALAMRRMKKYDWPGNVRELVNMLERARVLSPLGGRLEIEFPARRPNRGGRPKDWVSLNEHEYAYIEKALTQTRGKVYGDDGAAALLGLKPTTLQSRMRRHGLRADAFR